MKPIHGMLTTIFLTVIIFLNVSCMKILNNIAEDDPCTKAFVKRREMARTSDAFEKSQLRQEIEVLDQLCHERNTDTFHDQQQKNPPGIP